MRRIIRPIKSAEERDRRDELIQSNRSPAPHTKSGVTHSHEIKDGAKHLKQNFSVKTQKSKFNMNSRNNKLSLQQICILDELSEYSSNQKW